MTSQSPLPPNPPDTVDFLVGATAIADFLREIGIPMTRTRVYQWIEAGKLPAGRVGASLVASRSAIRRHLRHVTHGDMLIGA